MTLVKVLSDFYRWRCIYSKLVIFRQLKHYLCGTYLPILSFILLYHTGCMNSDHI